MALLELEPGARPRTGRRSNGVALPASRGGGRTATPVASGAPLRSPATPVATSAPARSLRSVVERVRASVWAPIVLKAFGIFTGMLALAAVGASSITRGAGVPGPHASGRETATFVAGGLTPLGPGTASLSASAKPTASSATNDAGTGAAPAESDAGADAATAPSSGLTPDGKVILNRASESELRRLPGVGAKRAAAIIALRTKLGGRFKRATDLLRVKGVGPKGLRKMEAHMVLDAP